MIKIKKLATLLLAVTATLSLTACHGSKGLEAFTVPDSFDENTNYEITFWAKNDTNKTQVQIYKDAIAEFESFYPNIKVNMKLYTDYGRIYNDVITNVATRTTPNVCITYPDHIATYMTGANVVVPLDDLFGDEKYGLNGSAIKYDAPSMSEIIPEFLNECKIGDNYYAIPYMRSTEALYVNKTYIEKLGYKIPDVMTWDFVWEVSEAAMAQNPDGTYKLNGQNVMIPFIYKSTDNMMITMLKQLGADYSDADGNILIFNDETKKIIETCAAHAATGAFSTFKISSYPGNFLNAGQCLFAIDSTAGATWMGTDAPNMDIAEEKVVQFETAVYPIPQYDVNNPVMMSQGPSICIFNKDDPGEVLASWLFAQFMLTDKVQTSYAETEGYVPVTSKAQQSDSYIDYLSRSGEDNDLHYNIKIDATKLLIENTSHTFVTPVFNGSASLRDAAGQLIESSVNSTRRKETVDEAYIEKLYSDTLSLYHLDQGTRAASGNTEKEDLGPLPVTSVTLIFCLVGVWVLIGAYAIYGAVKRKNCAK